ncbi:SET domain-containing protein-lysine N-methyltransferase [Kistimonas asteriae]|uniref:SET domain-containing protein-lysine N-methyltransferase n=1 Tax=Kistimonas asteriae TaxID=517724 RepID=UPI001BA9DD9A|nr:SET domain-containing protein-lysine N-methyltransferase [Kistimonas asteriae]
MQIKPIPDRHLTDCLDDVPLNTYETPSPHPSRKSKVKVEAVDRKIPRKQLAPTPCCHNRFVASGPFEQTLLQLDENKKQQVRLKEEENELVESLKSAAFNHYSYDGDTFLRDYGVVDPEGKGVISARFFANGKKVGDYEGELVYRIPDPFDHSKPQKYIVFKLSNDLSAFQPVRRQQSLQQQKCAIIPMQNDRYIAWSNRWIENTDIEIGRNGSKNMRYLNHSKQANVRLLPHPVERYILWENRHSLSIEVLAIDDIKYGTEIVFDYEPRTKNKDIKFHLPTVSKLTCLHKETITDQLNKASNHQLALTFPKVAKVTTPKHLTKKQNNPTKKPPPPTKPHKKTLLVLPPSSQSVKRKKATAMLRQRNAYDPILEKLIQAAQKAGVSEKIIFCTSNKDFKIPHRLWNTYCITWNKMYKQMPLNKNLITT